MTVGDGKLTGSTLHYYTPFLALYNIEKRGTTPPQLER
jgi:hypothetical protein